MNTRRDFIKAMGCGIASLILPGCGASLRGPAARKRRPNVLIFYTDDQGTLDVNCYGSKDLYTPNMDSLARSGVRFTQA
ncbi:MAG: sulfatase-like hydrolase/transferase [Planctomycetota bacterium]